MNNPRRYWNWDRQACDGQIGKRGLRGARSQWRGGSNFKNSGSRGGFRGNNRNQNYQFKNNVPPWNRVKRDTPGKRLSEEDIGVLQYISDHQGFSGVIKSRYSDFQVSEINEKGEVAVLTDCSAPESPFEEVEEDEDLLLSKYNLEILPVDTWDQINKLAVSSTPTAEVVEIDATEMSKEQRTKIHDAVKKAFAEAIVGSTVNVEDKKYVRFTKYRKGVRIDKRVKWAWPGDYVYFVLHKENCDTMDAAVKITERLKLNIRPSMLGYAGTKDRRAKTSQWMSVRRVDPRRVSAACRDLRDVHVGNYSFHDAPLKLGMLQGNKFRIALRNVTSPETELDAACERLRDKGFLNYYGLQRFGTRADRPTHTIGLKALTGDFRGAIDCILEERECAVQHALRVYHESGPAAAVQLLPRFVPQSMIEVRLLRSLARDSRDLLGAFNTLPRNNRLLYLHSYQSLVWNRCVSERVHRFGLKAAPGDLVPLATLHTENLEEEDSDMDDEVKDVPQNGNQDQDGADTQIKNTTENDKKCSKKIKSKDEKQIIPVKVLTQEDVDSGSYTLYDIVMPLPGYSIKYPPNMKDYYEEILIKDGLTLEMRHKYKAYSLSGAYRPVAVRPGGVRWNCVRYDDPTADLILSDLGHMQKQELTGIKPDGKYKALLLTMSLPASCYATVALRELMRTDTSGEFQAKQNHYHKETATGDQPGDTGVHESSDGISEGKGDKRKNEESNEAGDVKKLKSND